MANVNPVGIDLITGRLKRLGVGDVLADLTGSAAVGATGLQGATGIGGAASNITNWQSFTPTGSWTVNVSYAGWWRRVGDTLHVRVHITTTGAPSSGNLTVNHPSAANLGLGSRTIEQLK